MSYDRGYIEVFDVLYDRGYIEVFDVSYDRGYIEVFDVSYDNLQNGIKFYYNFYVHKERNIYILRKKIISEQS